MVEADEIGEITAICLRLRLLFLRICDANNAITPPDQTVAIGRRLRITMPEGIPEMPDAIG